MLNAITTNNAVCAVSQPLKSLCQGKNAKNNVVHINFGHKKRLSENDIFNRCYDKWIKIKRADDPSKTIVHEAVWFIAAFEFLFLQHPTEIIFDSELLKKKTVTQEKQRSRYLKQLADLYNINFHTKYNFKGKVYRYIYTVTRKENCMKILDNPELFYQTPILETAPAPDNLTTQPDISDGLLYIDEDNPFLPQEKERKGLSGSVLKECAHAREEVCADIVDFPSTNLEPTKPIAAATTWGSQQQLVSEFSKPDSPPSRADLLLPKLKNLIKSTFPTDVALDFLSNLDFQLLPESNKLRLISTEGYMIPQEHHQPLKDLIYEVYGPDTKITLRSLSAPSHGQQKVEPLLIVEQEEQFYNPEFKKPLWPIIRTRLVELFSEDLIRCWFDRLKCEEQPGTLIFRGRPVEIDYVATSRGNFLSALTLLAMKHDIDFYFCNDLGKIIQVTDEGAFDVLQIGVPLSSLKGTGIDDICAEFIKEEEDKNFLCNSI